MRPITHLSGRTAQDRGTAISLHLTGLPDGTKFTAYAISTSGVREIAASWSSTPDGRAVVAGATSIRRVQIARVEVVTAADEMPLTAAG